jgi:hypothetical protein
VEPPAVTSWYWATPFHGQVYGVELALKASAVREAGGK